LTTLLQDFRFGARTLAKNPGFTTLAVLTLALGIGANTAIFSVVNTVLLDHLPIRAVERLVVIWTTNPGRGWSRVGPTGLDYLDWKDQAKSFEDLFLFEHGTGTITGQGEPTQVAGLRVTTNFGDFFGLQPVLGRTFHLDEAAGRHNLMILSYSYWQRQFGADPNVVGRGVTLNGESYTIIGVIPASFASLFPIDVVVPFDNEWLKRADSDLGVLGRRKPGVSVEQSSAEMNVVAQRIAGQRLDRKGWGAVLVPLESVRVEFIRPALLVLLAGVGFVLLIACVNVANLLLARAVSREREVAMRIALGAGRFRLIRQFLVESTLIALAGGGAGLLLAMWGTTLLARIVPTRIPVPNAGDSVSLPTVHMDAKVVAFTLAVSLLTGILFGLVPALQGAKCNLNESLKEGAKGHLGGRQGRLTRSALVVAEAALAFVLVIGAGLMIKSFLRLLQANPGFNPEHLLTLRIKLANDAKDSKYREPRRRSLAFQEILSSVSALPGVRSAALTEIVPLSQDDMDMGPFTIHEAPPLAPGQTSAADERDVSPSFFSTMGIPLLSGRGFDEHDSADAARVVIIDATLARRYFPGQDPIGKHLQFSPSTPAREIVGVVGGVYDTGFDHEPRPTIYFPLAQTGDQTMSLVVRTDSAPAAILPSIKNAIWQVDKDQPIFNVKTMQEIISGVVSPQRLAFILLGVFAALALILAAMGIYGVVAYTVAQRTHEFGIRRALGAQSVDVLGQVIREGLLLATGGVALGIAGALVLTRFLVSLLYGVKSTDPWMFIGVSVLVAIVASLASYIPARRATQVDPLVALRYE
jgi:putative ABC transport system permease protein